MKFGNFIVHWSLAALKNFEENLSTYFGLITVSVKEASQITVIKRAQCGVNTLIRMFSCFSKSYKSTCL